MQGRHADPSGRRELPFEFIDRCRGGLEEVAIQPPKVALDCKVTLNCLDPIDCAYLAFEPGPGKGIAPPREHLFKAIVALGGKMPGGTRRHAAGDGPSVDDDHLPPRRLQFVGDGNPGNSRSYDNHVSSLVLFQSCSMLEHVRANPDGPAPFTEIFHAAFTLVVAGCGGSRMFSGSGFLIDSSFRQFSQRQISLFFLFKRLLEKAHSL